MKGALVKIAEELEEVRDWAQALATKAEQARKLVEGELQRSPHNQRASEIRKTMLSKRLAALPRKKNAV